MPDAPARIPAPEPTLSLTISGLHRHFGADHRVVVEVARTDLGGGRVGTAYAIDGGPLGAPSGGLARGVLWRYIHARLAAEAT